MLPLSTRLLGEPCCVPRKADVKVILTHENTDFDAVAAQLAASKLYPGAIPVLPKRLNREVRAFLSLYGEQLPFVALEDLPRNRVTDAILVDTDSVSAIKGMGPKTRCVVIDHHTLHGEPRPGVSYIIDAVGSTTCLLVEKLRELRMSLTPLEATLLLLGIYEDTGSLSYQTTTARDLRSAAWLLEQEASLEVAGSFLRHPLDERYQSVYGQLVENVQWVYVNGQAILIGIARLEEYLDELSTLAHKLDDIFDPDASFLLFAFPDHVQLIARSATGAVDVGAVARHFGGGGHGTAAAALINQGDVAEVQRRLREVLESIVKPLVTVREIMSYGAHTLRPDMLLSDAEQLMRRYGHEGFPVVEDGRLVGVLTRRELDQALHHGLTKATVRAYMHTGDVAVSPEDSVATVQAIMTTHGLGQVPVVQDGRLLGIVTRTDLIKLWTVHQPPSRRQEIRALLTSTLPAPLSELLWQARDMANEMGFSLYAVGGFVRDLMLGTPNLDLDLVVEGDAIALAKELARVVKGRVRAHSRFGVAKVILGGTNGTSLPPWLDFVTARAEFYQHPTALPEVERSSIKQDLYRRDFTINTMAICLDRDREGELLDHYGGERDLRNQTIRVLHNLSFVEDPTRILRAVRLEQRLGFTIESRTAELIDDALALLDRVSGVRLRHELELILAEQTPAGSIQRLEQLGVLSHLDPALTYDGWLEEKFGAVRAWTAQGQAQQVSWQQTPLDESVEALDLYLAMLTFRLTEAELDRFVDRMKFGQDVARYLRGVRELGSHAEQLDQPSPAASRIYGRLKRYSIPALIAFAIGTDSVVARENVEWYLQKLRWVRPTLDGNYLKSIGLKPGPIFGALLDELLDARLEGQVQSVSDEEALVQKHLARLAEH